MTMILNFFVERYLEKLSHITEKEICQVLGVKHEIKRLHERLERIKGVLQNADQKKHENIAINIWVRNLKNIVYDIEDIIDLSMFEDGKLLEAQLSSSSVLTRHDSQDYTVKSHETTPMQVKEDIIGTQIEDVVDKLIRLILENDKEKCSVLGIVGMGGIGKTTLAQKIYNDERIKDNFSKQAWLHVSKNYSDVKLVKKIVKGLGGNVNEVDNIAQLEIELISHLSSTRNFFLVLDDVWTANVWMDLPRKLLLNGEGSCTILFTTRDELVGRDMRANHVHPVEYMDEGNGWELLHKIVFGDEKSMIPGLQEVGIRIVRKCGGLPLAIKVMAGILFHKATTRREWERVLESDLWPMNQIDELPRALYLSYEDLPTHLKQYFLSCALYNGTSHSQDLVGLWVAEGFIVEQRDGIIEEIVEDYYKELV
ncbi:hypothetical protein Cni_G22164 [Canna indica]|uniref:Uncharacterized protein n=1 Tax=Canna indica TaxID=4628 RepID=A0AAQ3QJB8_9LILI|nr:hypothetical protein Cni_G22164 [Canna indica]